MHDSLVTLTGPNNVIGRSLVIHDGVDDLGRGDHPDSNKTGNAGGRFACGVIGTVSNLTQGEHGFHVHETGNLSMNCTAAGGHFNPTNMTHGAPNAITRHVGDLGNIVAGMNGVATIMIIDRQISLRTGSRNSIIGRAIVVHDGRDDLGLGGNATSLITGNAGTRFGCGIIRLVN
ncbi:unnamed protein product [Strongylus vulgaris]|uniref:Superoxide dismutase [Cu-Zn] n=1 Tax=Strongylus vulgaris TaxID=40348 RepID=A0A3P7LEJ6_STRVU|nr:unnamed protein product [Strongylus vulgaris]